MAVLFASCGGGGSNEETVELPQVKSIEVSPKNVTLHIYEPTYLTAKIYPEGAEHSCSWDVQGDQFLLYVEDRGIDSLFILSEKLAEFDVVLYENISGLKDVCHVTVTDDPVAVQRITLEQSELEVYEGGMCYLSATVFPFFATDSVKWKSEDQDIIVTSGENLINVRAGKRGIYVTAKKNGCELCYCNHKRWVCGKV